MKRTLCPLPLDFLITECLPSAAVVIKFTELTHLSVLSSDLIAATPYITVSQHPSCTNALHYINQS